MNLNDIIGDQTTATQPSAPQTLLKTLGDPKKDSELTLQKMAMSLRYDPTKFCDLFFPWGKGEFATSQGLRDWQRDITDIIGKHLQDPKTRHTPLQIAVASGHGIGKMQAYTDVVPTPRGMRVWGELKTGEYLFGVDGAPVKIISKQHFIDVPMYRVTFDDGSYCEVSSGHLWTVKGRQERRHKKDTWRTLDTLELLCLGVKRPNGTAQARQWEIPQQGAAQFKRKKVPLAPYLLGAWLGDGGRFSSTITSNDEEVWTRIEELGYSVHLGGKQGTPAKSVYVHCIKDELRALGIFDKYSYQKSVPTLYMENNAEVRAEVLRGLLDTDGEVTKNNSIGFSSCSLALAKDVIWLARSLGGKAKLQPTVKKPFFNDSHREKKAGRDCWRVTLQMPEGFKCFYIKRKQYRVVRQQVRYLSRWIESIEQIENSDGMCVTVENKDGLYLANDFVVTHNSSMVSMLIDWALSTCVGTKVVVTANTENQLRTKTWPEVTKWVRNSANAHWFENTATAVMSTEKDQVLNWRADAIPWSENNTEAFAGLHNAGKRLVLIFDESSAISDKVWEVAEGAMTDADTEIIWLAFGNPTQNTGRFRECFGKFKHRWITRQIDSRTVDGTNKAQIQTWIDDYGEDSDFVRVRVRGEFPRSGNLQFISSEAVDAARKRAPEAKLWDARVMGVDVARFGDDLSCICFRQGRDAQSNKWIKLRNVDTMSLAAHIVDAAKWFHPDAIFVDGGGVGGGVVDRLRMLRQPVFEVQFGGAPDRSVESGEGAVHYVNKRAEMWGNMREWLKGGSIPDDPDLAQELTAVQYGYLFKEGVDKILLEKKADMKKRGLASPDQADSLALTFAYPVMPSDHRDTFETAVKSGHKGMNYNPYAIDRVRNM